MFTQHLKNRSKYLLLLPIAMGALAVADVQKPALAGDSISCSEPAYTTKVFQPAYPGSPNISACIITTYSWCGTVLKVQHVILPKTATHC